MSAWRTASAAPNPSSRSQSEIDQLTAEAAYARDDIARAFPQAEQLAAARDRVAHLEEKLREMAAPTAA